MTGPNSTASAALDAPVLHPCIVGWLDFVGDPVRLTTAPYAVTFSGTGDADLDGFTFEPVPPEIIAISDVAHSERGSDTVTVTLSGLIGIDTDLLNIIGDRTKWRGRDARLWIMLYDASLAQIGNVWPFYTGEMVRAPFKGTIESQTIELVIENYLSKLHEASNRTYLDQASYDPGDLSAEAAIAIANGTSGASLRDPSGGGSYGGGGGVRGLYDRGVER